MRAQFSKTMLSVGQEDPRLVVLVGDIGAFGLRDFAAKCPGRFINAGIREQAMASAAAGMALTGFVPVIHSITPFVVERCFEQIKDDFAYHKLAASVVSVGGGIDYAALGCTHHSYSDLAMMKSLPGSKVFAIGSPIEFDVLFRAAYQIPHALNYFRLGGRAHGVNFEASQIKVGKGIKVRDGSDLTIIASGTLLEFAMKAAEQLSSSKGKSVEVLYFPTIKPFDAELVQASVRKTKKVVVAEDHSIYGGLGDEVQRAVVQTGLPVQLKALGVRDEFLREYGTFDHLADFAGIGLDGILRASAELL